ncbi:MAG: hypothetical protein EXX96DRAFT_560389 [Benjaminiella poitrasii]|nr:MAG: hypothetical protein EXX96DRAFT_560389 [Benjaminiella poitrasii]
MIDSGEILMDAPYQRNIVWNTSKMSALIESIFHNYYIPPLLFVTRTIRGKQTRIVIDGKQRLTSIYRFMRNSFPYRDTSSVDRYYVEQDLEADNSQDIIESQQGHSDNNHYTRPTTPSNYLTEDLFNHFASFEFVCVEYHNITEDDEYEVFSRVQLGVPMTRAERLKAHNTPIAEFCRTLAIDYFPVSEMFLYNTEAYLFQMATHLILTLKNPPTEFKATTLHLNTFVSSHWIPTDEIKDKAIRIFSVFLGIIQDPELKTCLTKRGNSTRLLRTIEFLGFGKYISLVCRLRDLRSYANDFVEFREYMMEKREGRMYLGPKSFMEAMEWIEEKIERHNLVPVIHPTPPDEMDELKTDEYEAEIIPVPEQHIISSRRQRRDYSGVPTARRGRRLPTHLSRRM